MKKVDLGQTINTLANIGVIAGIAFLAIEIAQNNDLIGFQIANDMAERRSEITDIVLANPDYFSLMAKDVETLSEVELDQITMLGIRLLLNMESQFSDYLRGVGDEDYTYRVLREVYWRPRLHYGVRVAWETYKRRADPEFVAWMEQNVIAPGPPE